jgi:hypothetical protein
MINESDISMQPPHNHQIPVVDLTFKGAVIQEKLQHTTIKLEYKSVNSPEGGGRGGRGSEGRERSGKEQGEERKDKA